MKDYAKEQILEFYGEEKLQQIEKYVVNNDSKANMILAYSEGDTFEILGGIMTNHSINVDYAMDLLDVNMDNFADEQGWESWNYEALCLIQIG